MKAFLIAVAVFGAAAFAVPRISCAQVNQSTPTVSLDRSDEGERKTTVTGKSAPLQLHDSTKMAPVSPASNRKERPKTGEENLMVNARQLVELPADLLSVYPIPSNERLTLVARDPKIQFAYLECIDPLGNTIAATGDWEDGAFQLSTKELPSGTYTILVRIENVLYRTKISVDHKVHE
jgi:hypothetical protein